MIAQSSVSAGCDIFFRASQPCLPPFGAVILYFSLLLNFFLLFFPKKFDFFRRMRDDKFDVFICHRGPDTKLTFASHLYEASKNAGISAFFDIESLVKGEDSWKCIERVISTKPIALVIFSKTFAESEWCLKELHLFLKRLPHVEVIPIFYDVRPEDVKMLPISSTIEQQDVRFQYRDDLEKASRIAGYCREESRYLFR